MNESRDADPAGFRSQVSGPRDGTARRLRRLAVGVLAIAALGFAVSQAGRLPGVLGDEVRAHIEADRDATGLFYTEVEGWDEWRRQNHSPLRQP